MDATEDKTIWLRADAPERWYEVQNPRLALDKPENGIIWDATLSEAHAILRKRAGLPEGFTRYGETTDTSSKYGGRVRVLLGCPTIFPLNDGWLYRALAYDRSEEECLSPTDLVSKLESAVRSSHYPVTLDTYMWRRAMGHVTGEHYTRLPALLSAHLRAVSSDNGTEVRLETGEFQKQWERQENRRRRTAASKQKARERDIAWGIRRSRLLACITDTRTALEEVDTVLPAGVGITSPCVRYNIGDGNALFAHLTNLLGLGAALGVKKKMLALLIPLEKEWDKVPDICIGGPTFTGTMRAYAKARGVRPGRLYPPHWISQAEAVSYADVFTKDEVTDSDRRRRKKTDNDERKDLGA